MSTDQRVLQLLGELVAMPTESRTANRGLIEHAADLLEAFGGRVTIIDGEPGRANLLASFGPQVAGGILLSGHTDVVPAGDGWTTEPYALTAITTSTAGEQLAGRGTADMKGFIACAITTIEGLDLTELTRPVHLALSYDEEIGCVGVRHLLAELAADAAHAEVRPELVLIGEPTMMQPRHSHLGKVACALGFDGRAGHSSLSRTQPSAIASAARVLAALEAVAAANEDVTVNVGTIHGGTALNVLAERCDLTFELRHPTTVDPDAVLDPLWITVEAERAALQSVGGGVRRDEITRYPALATDPSLPVVRLVERIADRGVSTSLGFGTEGGLFAATIDVPVVICGPGDIGVAHRPDEHVAVAQLDACLTFLGQLVEQLCTVP